MRTLLAVAAALLIAGCDRPPAIVFEDASITLPDDPNELPDLAGHDAVIENCTACHSPSTMLQQPRVPREKWVSIVGKMQTLYKAPVDAAAVPQIVDYLVAMQDDASHDVSRETAP